MGVIISKRGWWGKRCCRGRGAGKCLDEYGWEGHDHWAFYPVYVLSRVPRIANRLLRGDSQPTFGDCRLKIAHHLAS